MDVSFHMLMGCDWWFILGRVKIEGLLRTAVSIVSNVVSFSQKWNSFSPAHSFICQRHLFRSRKTGRRFLIGNLHVYKRVGKNRMMESCTFGKLNERDTMAHSEGNKEYRRRLQLAISTSWFTAGIWRFIADVLLNRRFFACQTLFMVRISTMKPWLGDTPSNSQRRRISRCFYPQSPHEGCFCVMTIGVLVSIRFTRRMFADSIGVWCPTSWIWRKVCDCAPFDSFIRIRH